MKNTKLLIEAHFAVLADCRKIKLKTDWSPK